MSTPHRTRAEMIAAGLSLEQQNDALLEKIAALKLQLDTAKGKAWTSGEYSDPDWFNRANYALRMTQREHQQVQRDIGEKNRRVGAVEQRFMDVARRRLDPDLFHSLMDEARS